MRTELENKKNSNIKGMVFLVFIQIFSTLSYSVLMCTLVLYMTKGLNFTSIHATTVTASFIAFNYTLHLFGGFISGRLFSHRSLFLFGMVLQVLGCLSLFMSNKFSIYWGLAIFLSGGGLNVTCINCMLTQFFEPHQKMREKAFMWNYSGMNIGFMLGFSISGIFEIFQKYHTLFLTCSFSNMLSIIILLFGWKNFYDRKTYFSEFLPKTRNLMRLLGFIFVISLIFALRWLVEHANFSNNVILFFGILMVFVIGFFALKQETKIAQKKIWAYLILGLMSLIFWSLYLMIPTGLVLFIENNVNRHFLGFSIPPQWVPNINAIIIILGGPILAHIFAKLRKKGIPITIPLQFSLALLFIGLGFLSLPLGINFANIKGIIGFNWIVISYLLQSIGELFIAPIGYAMIGQLIPHKLQGLMMGTWMMVSGVAAVLANKFSKIGLGKGDFSNPIITNQSFFKIFFILGISAIFIGIISCFLIPFLHRLIKEKKREKEGPIIPV